eukprot:13555379-Heterocapsa_arctica.AAC.1
MKILFGARLARFDLLRAVGALATKLNKWDSRCDRMLRRLVFYTLFVGSKAKRVCRRLGRPAAADA